MRRRPMMKYGVVGAVALAVLVAALWDGSKKKTADAARADPKADASQDTAVAGEVGSRAPAPAPPVAPAPAPMIELPKPIEDVLEHYQVHKGDTLKKIAKSWLGDESLAESLSEF